MDATSARLALDDYVATVVAVSPNEYDLSPYVDVIVKTEIAAELRDIADGKEAIAAICARLRARADDLNGKPRA